jgi:probable rRNA maturation factor
MERIVEVESEDPRLAFEADEIIGLFHFLDTDPAFAPLELATGDLAIRFVTPEASGELHAAFFGDPDPTDVMTFPGDPEDDHAGDLAVSPAYAADSAPRHGTTFAEELTLYLVHGWLHLVGHDDRTEEATREMRAAEAHLMERLHAAGKIPAFTWKAD